MNSDTIPVHCLFDSMVDPGDLVPHPRNPNRHPDAQLRALCASIRRYGWRHVITVSKTSGFIVAGHARRLAALALGVKCPVVYQTFASEAEELAFVIADNRLAELAVIDSALLDAALATLAGIGADMLSIGFGDYCVPDDPFDVGPPVQPAAPPVQPAAPAGKVNASESPPFVPPEVVPPKNDMHVSVIIPATQFAALESFLQSIEGAAWKVV